MGLEGPLCGFGEGDGSLAASMEARAGGELDTHPDLDTEPDLDAQPDPCLCIGPSNCKLQLD